MKATGLQTSEWKERLQEAVQAFKAGRSSAFEDIFSLSCDVVFRICVNIIGDHHAAEDAVQEVFLNVFRKLETFREEAAFTTWLYRIAVNTSLSSIRRKTDKPLSGDAFPDIETGADDQDAELKSADLALLRICIGDVDPAFRPVLVLRDVEGMSYDEIAAVQELPVGTVRSRLNRGRQQLKELFFSRRN